MPFDAVSAAKLRGNINCAPYPTPLKLPPAKGVLACERRAGAAGNLR
jgi:hypothetical protein